MKKSLLLLFMGLTMVLSSCKKSDDNSTNPPAPTDPIVGTWVSEGVNVPLGLRLLKVKKVVATFNENKTYTVVQTDSSNVTTTVQGTYTNQSTDNTDTLSTTGTKGAKIYNIVANQTAPAVTATGIYAINGSAMAYEVIQTSPVLAGVNPPTAQGGFGSTTVGGVKYAIYIQKYVKQ